MSIPDSPEGTPPPPETVLGAFVRHIEDQIAEIEGSAGAGSLAAVVADPAAAPAPATGAADVDPNDELDDLREVLRLGRHLLEGRQVTL